MLFRIQSFQLLTTLMFLYDCTAFSEVYCFRSLLSMLGFSAVALQISTILRILRIEENESLVSRITWPVGFRKDRRTEGQTSCNPERL